MSNDNPNNDFHWRDKLDGLEQLPVGYFDKNVSWDRLHARLGGKANRKKLLWFWLAAACLLAFFAIGLMNHYMSPAGVPKPGAVTRQTRQAELPAPVQRLSTVATNQGVKSKKLHQAVSHSLVAIKPVINVQQKSANVFDAAVIQNSQIAAPAPLAVNTLLPAKKLSVVHINELGDPAIESLDVTRNKNKHSGKFKLGDQEVVATSSIATRSYDFTIIKTKLSSN